MTASKLTDKQRRFVEEYLADLNATQAAVRAGYSEKAARYTGAENLAKPHIAEAISTALAERAKRTEVTADAVIQELACIGFSDLRKFFTPGGHLIDPQNWDDDAARAVASVKVVTRQTGEVDDDGNKAIEHVHEIRLWDKRAALVDLGKHLGLFSDKFKHEHSGPDGAPVQVESVSPRERIASRIAGLVATGSASGDSE